MRVLIIILLIVFCFFFECTTNPVAGGSSDHGNAKVCGVIVDNSGKPLENFTIEAFPDVYNPVTDSSRISPIKAYTDSSGRFSLDSLTQGDYTITGRDSFNYIGFTMKVVALNNRLFFTDSIVPSASGSIYLSTDSLPVHNGCILFFQGTSKYQIIDTEKTILLENIPKGIVTLKAFDPLTKKIIDLGKQYLGIEILPGRVLILPSRSPTPFCVKGDSLIRCTKAYTGDILTVTTIHPYSLISKSFTYRMSWGNGEISNWTSDKTITYSWPKPGFYQVQSQSLFQGQYLAWSDPMIIEIIDR